MIRTKQYKTYCKQYITWFGFNSLSTQHKFVNVKHQRILWLAGYMNASFGKFSSQVFIKTNDETLSRVRVEMMRCGI